VKSKISNKTFYSNLLGSGALARASEPNPILPMRQSKKHRRIRMFIELLGVLLVFGFLLLVGFSYGVTQWGNS
jgi:hypothetical protein